MAHNTAFLQQSFKIVHALDKVVVLRRDDAVDLLQLVNVFCSSAQDGSLYIRLESTNLKFPFLGHTLLNFGVLVLSPPLSDSPSEAD